MIENPDYYPIFPEFPPNTIRIQQNPNGLWWALEKYPKFASVLAKIKVSSEILWLYKGDVVHNSLIMHRNEFIELIKTPSDKYLESGTSMSRFCACGRAGHIENLYYVCNYCATRWARI